MKKEVKFIDAQEMAKKHPTTFSVPSQERLDKIHPGDSVKVAVEGERFWATVVEIKGNCIEATVNNDLVCTDDHRLSYKDTIFFEKKNIYNIY